MTHPVKIISLPFAEALSLGQGLTESHYMEVPYASDKIPFKLDIDAYLALEANGSLKVYVAMEGQELVGYMLIIAAPMPHHKGYWSAQTDSFYVRPDRRKRGILELLVAQVVEDCKEHGISSFHFVTNNNFTAAEEVAERIGALPAERSFVIEIGE